MKVQVAKRIINSYHTISPCSSRVRLRRCGGRRRGKGYRLQEGFTLLELIVALAILSLVAGAVVWNVRGMLPGMHLRAATRRLLEDCSGARFAALKENRRHVLAFCFPLGGTEWEWVVFRDDDADSRRGSEEPVLLRTSLSDLGYARLDMSRCRLPRNPDGVQVVVFDGRGMTVSPTGGFVSSSLYFVSSLGQELRVQFSQAGGVWINPGG